MTSGPRYMPVPPTERRRTVRRGVRVVVTDGESVLLLADRDPGVAGSRWWVTPGGGIDADESEADAAVRELAEETGLEVSAAQLVGPVMRRVAVHGYSDRILEQDEAFFVLRTARFEPDTSGHSEGEQIRLMGHAWVPVAQLEQLDAPVWPAELAAVLALVDRPEAWPWDLGRVEESTVPVSE